MLKQIKGSITAPKGFLAFGVASGVKKKGLDLGLLYSKEKAACAAFFTTNKVKAAPVLLCIPRVKKPYHRAVIINSGCANCLTGKKGIQDADLICKKTAILLGVNKEEVLPCSTGVIGKHLDAKKIISKLPQLVKGLSAKGSETMVRAIMTTDTFPKEVACEVKIGKLKFKIGAITKGAGMISPKMATTLCVVTTDAAIDKKTLHLAAKEAVENSYNCITVDGDMSTNDTFICLANGASGVRIKPGTKAFMEFKEAIKFVALELAKMIVKDGEGASKFIEIDIIGAKTKQQARKIAFGVANSSLVKTAIYGEDPNIGRIASACGASDNKLKQEKLDIYLQGKQVVKNGAAFQTSGIRNIFKKDYIKIKCNLNSGKAWQKVFTTDLTPEYVRLNAEYS